MATNNTAASYFGYLCSNKLGESSLAPLQNYIQVVFANIYGYGMVELAKTVFLKHIQYTHDYQRKHFPLRNLIVVANILLDYFALKFFFIIL